eukprot:3935122-Rhodomonas_salina.1
MQCAWLRHGEPNLPTGHSSNSVAHSCGTAHRQLLDHALNGSVVAKLRFKQRLTSNRARALTCQPSVDAAKAECMPLSARVRLEHDTEADSAQKVMVHLPDKVLHRHAAVLTELLALLKLLCTPRIPTTLIIIPGICVLCAFAFAPTHLG